MNKVNKSYRNVNLIDKNEVANIHWPSEDFYNNKDKKQNVLAKLRVALFLGNIEKTKCRIYFRDFVSVKMIETTIWAICEKNILIKSGMWIPIGRIIEVDI
jgi:hypothetical protein